MVLYVRKPTSIINNRLFLLYGIIGLCSAILIGGLFYRQLIQKDDFTAAAERQNYRRILKPGPRGNIYDRNGQLLVGNRAHFSVVVYLNELRPEFRREFFRLLNQRREIGLNPIQRELSVEARTNVVQSYLNQVNRILGLREVVDAQSMERHFSQSLLLPFPLIRDLDSQSYARLIEQLPVESPVQVITDTARYYPHTAAASHALGFVSESSDIPAEGLPGESLLTFRFSGKIGRSGLEAAFNEHLQGHSGGEIWSVDPSGFQYEKIVDEQAIRGRDLVTSLDIRMQKAAEDALGSKTGAVVAIDIATGEVLVSASKPNFDLNDLSPFISYAVDDRIREEGGWLNRSIQGLYPPGSTFKLVTALAGLRHGVIDAETEINCPGFHMVGRRIFRCNRRNGHGDENLIEAIRDSCNVFFYVKSLEMGAQAIADESRRFHLHEPTGIELPGETRGMHIPDAEWKARRFYGEGWFGGDTANLSIGQGFLLVTPLQMATFAAAIARGDTGIRPTLLHPAPDNPASAREPRHPEPLDIPDSGYQMILAGMREAGRIGTARHAATEGMPVAGKTGTAQVRKDGKPTTIAWFVGFAPADKPTTAIAVMVEGVVESSVEYGGGSTAAPIARAVFSAQQLQPGEAVTNSLF